MSWKRAFCCVALLAASCGKFTLSPYVAHTDNIRLNERQVEGIRALESSSGDAFKVAVISDTHNYYDELAEQIDYINGRADEYRFVIIGGDLTNLGLLREFETAKELLDRLKIPYVSAVGNHDLLSNGGEIFGQMFGRADFSFVFKQTKFIFFNNNNWESSGKVPDLDYVESELASSTATHNVLVAHVSPGDKDRWSEKQKADMRQLISAYGADYFLNGHDHNPGTGEFGGAVQVTIGASSKGRILELRVSNAQVEHEHVRF